MQINYDNYDSNPQKFLNGLKELGIAEKSNIDLYGEEKPVLYDNASYLKPGSLVSLAYGYEMGFALIQILIFTIQLQIMESMCSIKLVSHYIDNNNLIPAGIST